jgi:SWI/SNF-related matrix-associated actin-dependent regulator of chromatin subfamily A protein 2/4
MTYEDQEERMFGRGTRSRKTVDYSETLTDRQWVRAVEDGTLEEVEEQKKQRKKKKKKSDKNDDPSVSKVRGKLTDILIVEAECLISCEG